MSRRNIPLKTYSLTKEKSSNIKRNNIITISEFKPKPLINNNNSLKRNNNNNIFYSKHISPSSNRKSSLAPLIIENNFYKKVTNTQKKEKNINSSNNNSYRNITYSQKKFLSPTDKERTQTELSYNKKLSNDKQNNKTEVNNILYSPTYIKIDNNIRNKYKTNIRHINNNSNINHDNYNTVDRRRMNSEYKVKNTRINKTQTKTSNNMSSVSSILNNIDNTGGYNKIDKNLISKRINDNRQKIKYNNYNNSSYDITPQKGVIKKNISSEIKIIPIKINYGKNNLLTSDSHKLINSNIKEKNYQKDSSIKKNLFPSLSNYTNGINKNTKNQDIINNNKNYKRIIFKKVDNPNNKDNYNKPTKKIQIDIPKPNSFYNKDYRNNKSKIKEKNYEIKKVNTCGNIINNNKKKDTNFYLIEFNDDNNRILILFLKLIQIHIDIELLLDNNINNINNAIKNNDKLKPLINNYFNTLSYLNKFDSNRDNNDNNESKNNKNEQDDIPTSNLFLYQKYNIFNVSMINNLFHKCIKLQIYYYALFIMFLSHFNDDSTEVKIENTFVKIIKEISKPLFTIFKIFIMNELKDKYNRILSSNFKPNFFENINKLYSENKNMSSLEKDEILKIITNDLNICIDSFKLYSKNNLKDPLIKPFSDAFYQILSKLDRISINKYIYIFLNMLLYSELEVNKQKMKRNLESSNKNISKSKLNNKNKFYDGSAIYNNINEKAPFLPEINPKYKYTLVLDIDETLIHYFLAVINGMMFIRPYCIEFLNELNKYYEIVTFTSGMKDYADNILNILDINNNIVKYRLYREHISESGFKDLKLLGRDLKKTIIIDNLEENFTLQPDNGLYIKSWTSDINDIQFKDLLNILKSIAINNVDDVRLVIQVINSKIKDNEDLTNPYSKINIQKIIEDVKNKY